MELVPLPELSDELWEAAWATMYDPKLGAYMGVDASVIAAKPSLVDFYARLLAAHQAKAFMAWALVKDGAYLGHVVLDKSVGEWELGAVLKNPADWGSGMGVRAALHALKWAFTEANAEFVVAFTQGHDPHVRGILEKGGFRPLFNYWLMDERSWRERWGAKER